MEKSLIISIIVLVMINITDSITNSVVGPSLIFYVKDMGGSKEQYGMIMSAAYLSGFIMMSFYGAWVDSNGNKYKAPYAAAFTLGIVGSFIYFLAVLFPKGNLAIGAILIGRLITGLGASGRTLAYSWVATAIPREEQRTILTIMSMTRSFGMILGPLLNTLVAKVDTELVISSNWSIPVNPYNSCGLIVVIGEGILFVATFLFLKDPAKKMDTTLTNRTTPVKKAGLKDIWEALTDFDLALPMINLFVMMCSFTFYQVAIPPVASHAFDWSPIQISDVLAAQAVILFLGMCTSMILSMTSAPDISMIVGGNLFFVIGGVLTYYRWTIDSAPWQFVVPIMIVSLAYPFIGPANRSKFTKAVHSRPELEHSHGVMQSIFNQSFMIGGFLTPNFVTAFILRSPEEIDQSGSPYELSLWAWLIPISSLIMIVGLIYEEVAYKGGTNELGLLSKYKEEDEPIEETPATEATKLLAGKKVGKRRRSSKVGKGRRSSVVEIQQHFSRQYEVDRRSSVEANGIINPFETRDEINLRNRLLEDKKEWDELAKLDAAMEEQEEDIEME